MIHRRLLTMLTAVAFVAGACGGDNDDSSAPDDDLPTDDTQAGEEDELRGGEMTWGVLGEITTLRPFPNNTETFALRSLLYEPLIVLDEDREPVGVLAEQVEISPDNTELTLTLRDGVAFHDGTALDADAVLWNFDRLLDDDVVQGGKDIFVEADISAPDPSTVQITFPRATPQAAGVLQDIVMVSPEADLDGGVGTGPFVVDEFAAGDSLRVVANDDYRIPGSPLLDAVTLQTFPDPAALVVAVEGGTVDYMFGPAFNDAVRLQSNDAVRVETRPSTGQMHLLVNPTKGCLTDKRVRQALSLAFDRERFVESSLLGFGTVQTQTLPPASPAYSEALNSDLTFDLDAAQILIDEAGCDVQVELQGSAHLGELSSFLPVYVEDLASIGVDATIRDQDRETWLDNFTTGNFELSTHWYGSADLDPGIPFAQNVFNGNFGQWTDDPSFAEYSQLIGDAQTESDQETRLGMYEDIARIVQQEGLTITIANPEEIRLLSAHLKDVAFAPATATVDLTQAYIEE